VTIEMFNFIILGMLFTMGVIAVVLYKLFKREKCDKPESEVVVE